MNSSPQYTLPTRKNNAAGELRKVGVEIEFAGMDTATAAKTIVEALGGTLDAESKHLIHIRGSEIGDMRVELDTQYAHPQDAEEPEILKEGRELLGTAVQSLVPQEMVTDPVPIDKLHLIDKATDALTAAGATGTHKSILHAFGMHLNPEIASPDADYLLAVMRAMVLLDAKIYETLDPDFTRRTMGWAQSWTPDYEARIMDPDHEPGMDDLIADYIRLNKGRNHHLDMLPVFAHVAADKVAELVSDGLVSARPAFHFRLPDSRIGQKDWTIRNDWNLWVEIEEQAEALTRNDLQAWCDKRARS